MALPLDRGGQRGELARVAREGELGVQSAVRAHRLAECAARWRASGRRRAAYTMRYANARTVHVDTAEHWVPVYLVRGEADNPDYIDLRPGQPLPKPIS